MKVPIGVFATLAAALLFGGQVGRSAESPSTVLAIVSESGNESSRACAATTVQFTAIRRGLPHVDARGLRGDLVYYTGSTLMDGRVNGSDGLVIYTRGRSGGKATKILWTIPRGAGRVLRISGRRLDGDGAFVERWRRVGRNEFPSIVAVPRAGCWQLSITSGKVKNRIIVHAIEPPPKASCDATPVYRREPPHPRFGPITWMPATPRTGGAGGVAAVLFVTVFPDRSEAVIPAGGQFPGGPNTKFLWWAPRPGGPLRIIGRQLDGEARLRQVEDSAAGGIGNYRDQIIFPSIIDVPAAGCWSITLRTGQSAGHVVFQVVPTDPQPLIHRQSAY